MTDTEQKVGDGPSSDRSNASRVTETCPAAFPDISQDETKDGQAAYTSNGFESGSVGSGRAPLSYTSHQLKEIGKSKICQEPPEIKAAVRSQNVTMFLDGQHHQSGQYPQYQQHQSCGPLGGGAHPGSAARPMPQMPHGDSTDSGGGGGNGGGKRGSSWREPFAGPSSAGSGGTQGLSGIHSRLVDGDGSGHQGSGGDGASLSPQRGGGRGDLARGLPPPGWRQTGSDNGIDQRHSIRGPAGLGGPEAGQRQPRGPDPGRGGMAVGRGRGVAVAAAASLAPGRPGPSPQPLPSKQSHGGPQQDSGPPPSDGDWRSAKGRGGVADLSRDWQQMGHHSAPRQASSHSQRDQQTRDRGAVQGGRGLPRGPPVGADTGPKPPWVSQGGSSSAGSRHMTPAAMEAEHQAMREAARAKRAATLQSTAVTPTPATDSWAMRPSGEPEAMTDADWAELAGNEGEADVGEKATSSSQITSASIGAPVAAAVGPPPGFENISRPSSAKAPPPGFEKVSPVPPAPLPAPARQQSGGEGGVPGTHPQNKGTQLLAALHRVPSATAALPAAPSATTQLALPDISAAVSDTGAKKANSRFGGRFFQLEDADSGGKEEVVRPESSAVSASTAAPVPAVPLSRAASSGDEAGDVAITQSPFAAAAPQLGEERPGSAQCATSAAPAPGQDSSRDTAASGQVMGPPFQPQQPGCGGAVAPTADVTRQGAPGQEESQRQLETQLLMQHHQQQLLQEQQQQEQQARDHHHQQQQQQQLGTDGNRGMQKGSSFLALLQHHQQLQSLQQQQSRSREGRLQGATDAGHPGGQQLPPTSLAFMIGNGVQPGASSSATSFLQNLKQPQQHQQARGHQHMQQQQQQQQLSNQPFNIANLFQGGGASPGVAGVAPGRLSAGISGEGLPAMPQRAPTLAELEANAYNVSTGFGTSAGIQRPPSGKLLGGFSAADNNLLRFQQQQQQQQQARGFQQQQPASSMHQQLPFLGMSAGQAQHSGNGGGGGGSGNALLSLLQNRAATEAANQQQGTDQLLRLLEQQQLVQGGSPAPLTSFPISSQAQWTQQQMQQQQSKGLQQQLQHSQLLPRYDGVPLAQQHQQQQQAAAQLQAAKQQQQARGQHQQASAAMLQAQNNWIQLQQQQQQQQRHHLQQQQQQYLSLAQRQTSQTSLPLQLGQAGLHNRPLQGGFQRPGSASGGVMESFQHQQQQQARGQQQLQQQLQNLGLAGQQQALQSGYRTSPLPQEAQHGALAGEAGNSDDFLRMLQQAGRP